MRKTTSLFCLLTLLSVASSFAGISVDHDKSADFSQYRSFTIKEATPAINPLMREWLIKAIEVGLGAKGLEKVDDGADLKVVVHTDGDIFFDPVLLIDDAETEQHTAVASYTRTFGLAGRTARLDELIQLVAIA